VPRVVGGLEPNPDPSTIAEHLPEADPDVCACGLPLIEDVVKVLPRDSEALGDLCLGESDRRQDRFAQRSAAPGWTGGRFGSRFVVYSAMVIS
jgi:hypothetical protein